ncbi:UDP-N-acetylmuramoyl-tripeptide--D-alanyl-D-alanine ligase [Sungkyunkwania multivorans]|uniref:UDP-N-acetylmuramoyl-tripeptide--D-alanyl-D-alanine ligase n=1 Tax=Sungkyunkwania multivorans TaxID=1173618 RepID=A0ABW3D1S0_9FLAO
MNIEQLYKCYLQSSGVCTDTRKISANCIFFALKGANFNGNAFAEYALSSGARFAVIDEKKYQKNDQYILVEDALQSLQELANHHRKRLKLPIISMTGSNGKTTTKELINAVLSKKFKTIATQGNLNNHIGVPLTLLDMRRDTEIGIVEMGANHLKEIAFLCTIAEPDHGYITNFGKAHIEGFGSEEAIVRGKSELYDHLRDHSGLIVFNGDDHKQIKQVADYQNTYSFSEDSDSDVQVKLLSSNPMVRVAYKGEEIQSNLIGAYNFSNIAAAIAIGDYFKVDPREIKSAVENYVPSNNRSQIIKRGSNTVILDAYNANPSSMKAAIDNLANLESNGKVVFLGDMFELGATAAKEHQFIADHVARLNFDEIHLLGRNFSAIQNVPNGAKLYQSFEDFKMTFDTKSINDSHILIKGSRGMALERILELL